MKTDQSLRSSRSGKRSVVQRTGSVRMACGANGGIFAPLSKLALFAALALAGSVPAQAAFTYTYTPTAPTDLSDLDHHNAYGWVLSGLDTTKTYTGASLKITNINNWDLTKNMLFVHLFDTLKTAPSGTGVLPTLGSGNNIVTSFQDVDPNQIPVIALSDAFGADIATNPLVNTANTSNILLGTYVDGSYSGSPTLIDGVNVPNYQTGTYTPSATTQANNAAQTVTFNFNALQLQKLNEYISGGATGGVNGRIGFGFDSDCHFFNDGIEFTMISDVPPPPIPEPATMLTGLACLVPVFSSVLGRRRKSSLE